MSKRENKQEELKCYLIHDNGDRPYCVHISNLNRVNVYKREYNQNYEDTYAKLILSVEVKKVFIGKSPKNDMTDFSGGWGEYFDGNSILLHIDENKYIFVGQSIYSFKSENLITNFVSPVGNNDVPYPYAIDTELNYYFLIENGIMKIEEDIEDPYSYYYDKLRKIKYYANTEFIVINDNEFHIKTAPNPKYYYDDLTKRIGSPIYIKKNNIKEIIRKWEYIDLLTGYNNLIGLRNISSVTMIDKNH